MGRGEKGLVDSGWGWGEPGPQERELIDQEPRGEQVAPANPGAIQVGASWDLCDNRTPFSCLTILEFHRLTKRD